jgi:hypothetical protein
VANESSTRAIGSKSALFVAALAGVNGFADSGFIFARRLLLDLRTFPAGG